MSTRCPELASIRKVVDLYIDGVQNGNLDAMRQAFHPQSSMFGYKGKVFSVVPLELQPGVTGEDFVKFWLEEYAPLGQRLGWESHVLKADSGERVDQYAVIWEIPSVEARDRITFGKGQLTEEGKQLLEPDFQVLNKKLNTFVTGWPDTGYIELGR